MSAGVHTPGAGDLHPWNRGFRWRTPAGPCRRLRPAQVRAFDEDGFFVLEDAVAPEALAAVTEAIDPFDARLRRALSAAPDGKVSIAMADTITFAPHLVARSPLLRDFSASALFADLAHDLMGPDARLYWDQSVYKRPERPRAFPWHQDNGYTFVEPQQYLACWVALTDATPESGCPWVARGVHRRGTLRHWLTPTGWQCLEDPDDSVPAPVRAGGVVVFSSLTPHRTGPNRSDGVRKAYILQYAPDGAVALRGDPRGEPVAREPQDDPARQFPVRVRGERPEAPGAVTR